MIGPFCDSRDEALRPTGQNHIPTDIGVLLGVRVGPSFPSLRLSLTLLCTTLWTFHFCLDNGSCKGGGGLGVTYYIGCFLCYTILNSNEPVLLANACFRCHSCSCAGTTCLICRSEVPDFALVGEPVQPLRLDVWCDWSYEFIVAERDPSNVFGGLASL